MTVIKFENVSKRYKLYTKGGLYLRDRITHALGRLNPLNGGFAAHGAKSIEQSASASVLSPMPHAPSPLPALERDFWALKNISFEIKQGESVGFIGRNGAGKSTILKLLAGVTKPSSGTMGVDGRVAALIEVGAGFHPELTGRENIFLNGSILGMKKVEIEKQFDSIVAYAELEHFIDTPVKHYSSGMFVRLGFAIAAHTNPDIYLIDEVLAVGDEAFQKKCLDTLAAQKAAGKTMILVTHSLDKVEEVCDRCVYVNHGEVGFDGSPEQAISKYRLDIAGITLMPAERRASELAHHLLHKGTDPHSDCERSSDWGRCTKESIPADKGRGEGFFLHISKYKRQISVLCGEPVRLEFDLESPLPITETTVSVTIVDLRGVPVISMSSKVQNIPRDRSISRFWKTVCDMGAIPLNAGIYFARIYVGDGERDHARFKDVFVLRVTPNDVFGWGRDLPGSRDWGPVFWAPNWNIEPLSKLQTPDD